MVILKLQKLNFNYPSSLSGLMNTYCILVFALQSATCFIATGTQNHGASSAVDLVCTHHSDGCYILHFPSLIFIGSQVSSNLGLKCLSLLKPLKMRFLFSNDICFCSNYYVIWNKKNQFFNVHCYLFFALSQLRV